MEILWAWGGAAVAAAFWAIGKGVYWTITVDSRVDSLEREVERLRGQVDEMRYRKPWGGGRP